MAKDVILLGEVAAKGAAMIEIRCGRCDGHGRLSVKRLRAEWRADASIRDIMREQIGSCPHKDDAQLYTRCDPYCQRWRNCSPIPGRGLVPGLTVLLRRGSGWHDI